MTTGQAPDGPDVRAPETVGELLFAHCRPQPAIPSLIVFAVGVLLPVMAAASEPIAAWLAWLVPVGIVASCVLAIAAGFCSLFPPAAWIAIAFWAAGLVEAGRLPGYNRYVLAAGMIAAALMIALQLWRAMTGRFVPTIRIDTQN